MDQCEVYSARGGALEATVTLPRSHGKHKRDQGELMDDAVKLTAMKISRQSPSTSDSMTTATNSETNAMSVLPRLLRTMTNRNPQVTSNGNNRSTIDNNQVSNEELTFSVSTSGPVVNDSDSSSSSSSSFISTPSSSGSSLISFLSPGNLGPVAAMAAVALSTAVTTMSMNDIQESSGLVTLATASSLIEKEWRARAAIANNENGNNAKEHAETTLAVQHHTDLLASTLQANVDRNQQFPLDGSPPLVISALNTSTSQSLLNDSTPVTRAVLNVQSLAAFIRETQKQCSLPSPTTTSLELPLTSVFPLPTETKLTSSCNMRQTASPSSYLLPAPTSSFLVPPSAPQNLPTGTGGAGGCGDAGSIEQSLHSETVPQPLPSAAVVNSSTDSSPLQSTAFISLQPAPGSLISPSDLQQLVASGEFMSSAARQTLLGQSSDGSTRQLYLLVPSDCPVIMPRVSNNQQTMAPILPSTSPLIESIPTNAPILEAISPGVEPDDNCVQMPSESSTSMNTTQPVLTSVSHLATTMLNPMNSSTSTALSTFLAGLEARNQPMHQQQQQQQQIQLGGLPLSTVASPLSCSYNNPSSSSSSSSASSSLSVHTTDSLSASNCAKLRIPLQISGLPIPESSLLSVQPNNVYPIANNATLKSDPDMYTPNGHAYSSLVDEANRFRSYPTYTQQLSQHIPHSSNSTNIRQPILTSSSSTSALSTTSNNAFFHHDTSNSMLINQVCSVPSSGGNSLINSSNHNNNANESLTNGHFQSSISRPNIAPVTTTFAPAIAPKTDTISKSNNNHNSMDECRRNSVTGGGGGTVLNTSGSTSRSEQGKGSTTYLEHLESKDIRRRVSHNEVERRRRDRINTWISELYKLLPPDEQTKSQYQSKGIVLKRVCEYFQNVDSMLKAANSAVEQIRVENTLLRQRVRELQQENQLLSASLQLGAAAAAAHLKNRQPRPGTTTVVNGDEVNNGGVGGVGVGGNAGGLATLVVNKTEDCTVLKDSIERNDYQHHHHQSSSSPMAATVFTVDGNIVASVAAASAGSGGDTTTDYRHFNQTNLASASSSSSSSLNCITSAAQAACFTTSLASINALGGGFNNHVVNASEVNCSNGTSTLSSSSTEIIDQVICPLTLPSLDHMTTTMRSSNSNNNNSNNNASAMMGSDTANNRVS